VTVYSCCGESPGSQGCYAWSCHVPMNPIPLNERTGFMTTFNKADDEDQMGSRPWDVVGVDCEMVYTTHGSELARVTVVDVCGKTLLVFVAHICT